MTQITRDEIETTLTDIYNRLTEAKRQIREEIAEGLVGRKVTINRTLKSPATGEKVRCEVEATVTGLRWSYEDSMEMVIEYNHPFTGETVKGEEMM